MEYTQVRHCGFIINCRVPTSWLDLNIITEVIGKDEYGMNDFNQVGYNVKTILDIGGHIGGFGLLAKSLWPDAKLIAIEPNKENHELYIRNLISNGLYTNCNIIRGAVGYNKECNCLVHAASTTGGGVMRTRKEADKYVNEGYRFYDSIDEENVDVYTIEELTDGLDVIDFAKWDCEGSEIDCFENMTCQDKFRFMAGEYHIWNSKGLHLGADVTDCIKFWQRTKRKFPHLYFTYKNKPLGLFQAWPKEIK